MYQGEKASKVSKISDEMLVKRCCEGEKEAFAELFERHKSGIFSFVLRLVKSREEAEDLTQEIFLNAYRALSKFKSGALFKPWLYKIASNACISAWRKTNPNRALYIPYDESQVETMPDSKSLAMNYYESSEIHQLIRQTVSDLPEGYRIAILLRYEGGLSYKEIASALGISVSAVSTRLYEARKLLERKLKKYE